MGVEGSRRGGKQGDYLLERIAIVTIGGLGSYVQWWSQGARGARSGAARRRGFPQDDPRPWWRVRGHSFDRLHRVFSVMNGNVNGSWSVRSRGLPRAEVRIHVYLPLLALTSLLASRLGDFPVRVSLIGCLVLLLSIVLHELARAIVARRMGGRSDLVVLGPIGGWAEPDLPADPPAHVLTALAGATSYLVMCVAAGCVLATGRGEHVVGLLSPFLASVCLRRDVAPFVF